mmetsp:Transcript_22784/g.68102  ORF Transcript_22784/g.68102 Transcript_22784/m.68102 type:complete len:234 (+) Transcript_22784:547-1248(+)
MGPSLKPWIFSTVRNRFSSISKCDSSCFFFLVLCFWIAARRAPLLPVCSGSLTSSSSSSGRFSLTLSKISTSVSLGGSRGSGLGGLTPAIMPARRIVVRAVCVSCSCSSRSSSALWALAARNVSSANLASASRSRLSFASFSACNRRLMTPFSKSHFSNNVMRHIVFSISFCRCAFTRRYLRSSSSRTYCRNSSSSLRLAHSSLCKASFSILSSSASWANLSAFRCSFLMSFS